MEKLKSIRQLMEKAPEAVLKSLGAVKKTLKGQLRAILDQDATPQQTAAPANHKYQTLSIVVPGGCPNECKFCVSRTHREDGIENVLSNKKSWEKLESGLIDRLVWTREKGTDTVVLTGTSSEPIVHHDFLEFFARMNGKLPSPFRKIEIQSSGVGLDDKTIKLLKKIGVKYFALSISSFDDDENARINGTKSQKMNVNIAETCAKLKEAGINIRLCLNLNSAFDDDFAEGMDAIFDRCIELGADQVTFRKLYQSKNDTPEDRWMEEHEFDPTLYGRIFEYVKKEGTARDRLPFGAIVYTVKNRVATIIDDDSMNSTGGHNGLQKFAILREDGCLYYDWRDKGTKIF